MEKKKKKPSEDVELQKETYFKHSIWKTEKDLNTLAEKMVHYIRNTKNCYSITHFLVAEDIRVDLFYDWVKRSENLKNALIFSKQIIAVRRENGVLSGELPLQAVMPYMSMYCPEYKKHAEEKAALFRKMDTENPTIKVLVDQVANSDMVKIRNEE